MRKFLSLGLAVGLAAIYLVPLCPNLQMLAGLSDAAMCAEETSCCSVMEGDAPALPTCCDTTILAFERRDADDTARTSPVPPALAEVSWPDEALLMALAETASDSSLRYLSPPPLLLSLRL